MAEQRVELSRDLGLFTITMVGVGAMIGAGIFVLTGEAAGISGPALVLSFTSTAAAPARPAWPATS
jgi:amino acid transporter